MPIARNWVDVLSLGNESATSWRDMPPLINPFGQRLLGQSVLGIKADVIVPDWDSFLPVCTPFGQNALSATILGK